MATLALVRTADFDFELPAELIAQVPAAEREDSRLLVLDRGQGGKIAHHSFRDLPQLLRRGDVLVLNNSRVIPARLRGRNARTGGSFEILLLEEEGLNDWWAMLRPGKRAGRGTEIVLQDAEGNCGATRAVVLDTNEEGHRRLKFSNTTDIAKAIEEIGEVPLPPYIDRGGSAPGAVDRERYQTVYAKARGSVAAPTAGLHFSEKLLENIRARGIHVCFVTLHVGLGTFAPVKGELIAAHRMHEERFAIPESTAQRVNDAKSSRRRVVAVGTTAVRVLETMAERHAGKVVPGQGRTRIFLHPPCDFRIVDALVTNFHLPRSTLIMLAAAFAAPGRTSGRETILRAYQEAIRERYRFFSYGDAMLIV